MENKKTEEVKNKFRENKRKVESGELVGLPWIELFPRLGEYIPVIPPATPIMITANSGVGKSKAWVGMILISLYLLRKKYPDKKFKIRFLISLLEDTEDEFITRLYSAILLLKYNIRVDGLELNSQRKNPLSKEIDERLDDVQKEIDELLSEHCEITDSIYHPTGLYKWGRAISNKLGTHHYKEVDFVDDKGKTYKQKVYSHYEPNDPEEQVIWIIDNLNNLAQETSSGTLLTDRQTINKWTRTYTRLQITKHWKWSVVNILQQASDSEAPLYNNRGELIIERCKPSLAGLGNSKECQRDHLIIFGLFSPDRYGVKSYKEFNITRLGDNFKSFIILKSNISICNVEVPMYFDGVASIFKELPLLPKMKKEEAEKEYKAIEDKKINLQIK